MQDEYEHQSEWREDWRNYFKALSVKDLDDQYEKIREEFVKNGGVLKEPRVITKFNVKEA